MTNLSLLVHCNKQKVLNDTQCCSDLPDLASLNRSMKPLNARNKIGKLGYEPMSARNQALEPFRTTKFGRKFNFGLLFIGSVERLPLATFS